MNLMKLESHVTISNQLSPTLNRIKEFTGLGPIYYVSVNRFHADRATVKQTLKTLTKQITL